MGQNSDQRRKKKLKAKQQKRKQMNAANRGSALLDAARRKYVDEWSVTSGHFDQASHYGWMASHIDGFRRVLEVGCGVGYSTLALLKSDHDVVTIDENPAFVDATQAFLTQKGFAVSACKRGTSVDDARDPSHYAIRYHEVSIQPAQAMLVEGDILDDSKLETWLKSVEPFDAVICWLFGTHNYRGANTCRALSNVHDSSANRLITQNRIYELAEIVLRSGGVLNIIDRMEYPDGQIMIDGLLQWHREKASVTTLRADKWDAREYHEPVAENATRMVMRVPSERDIPVIRRIGLVSLTSVKP